MPIEFLTVFKLKSERVTIRGIDKIFKHFKNILRVGEGGGLFL